MEQNKELISGNWRFMCLGKTVALVEINKIIRELLRRYNIILIDHSNPWNSVNAGILLQKEMWLRIARRDG